MTHRIKKLNGFWYVETIGFWDGPVLSQPYDTKRAALRKREALYSEDEYNSNLNMPGNYVQEKTPRYRYL